MDKSKFIIEVYKNINKQKILYEGLIKSYSKQDTINMLQKLKSENRIDSFSIENGANLGNFYFIINIKSDENDALNKAYLFRNMNTYGYFLLRSENSANGIEYVFEPKYTVDITNVVYNDYDGILYHVTSDITYNKILKQGLVPKSCSEIGKYPDRIFFTLNNHISSDIAQLKNMFYDEIHKGIVKCFYELKIKLDKNIIPHIKLYYDNNMSDSIFTLDNIPNDWIIDTNKIEL